MTDFSIYSVCNPNIKVVTFQRPGRCVCLCMCEREREGGKGGRGEREREREHARAF